VDESSMVALEVICQLGNLLHLLNYSNFIWASLWRVSVELIKKFKLKNDTKRRLFCQVCVKYHRMPHKKDTVPGAF
jgi:hypothetical protein